MKPSGIVTFTTDFGTVDSYIAQMKGVALRAGPDLRLVDLCHEVPPGAIGSGAYVLETGYGAFPPGTVHVAVIDPGVGTDRRALALRAGDHLFVAPDNGILDRVLRREPLREAVSIEHRSGRSPRPSTFDGRDLFAPAAARLACGQVLRDLGPPAADPVRPVDRRPAWRPGVAASVPVIHVDRFGNVVVDLEVGCLERVLGEPARPGCRVSASVGGMMIDTFRSSFAGGGPDPFLLINSAGYLEIALEGAPAGKKLGLHPGATVELVIGS